MARRPRNPDATRADLLAAARTHFATHGYERTTMRAVAADVGVDPALAIRYFGSKEGLFAAAAEFHVPLPDLTSVPPDALAALLLPRFFAVWEQDKTFLALLRAAATNPTAAAKMREVFVTQVAPALSSGTQDHGTERAALLGAFVIGLATSRYILATPGIADMSHEDLARWTAPVIRQILAGQPD
jgi:AcrR family transcriptional regulator